MEIIKNQIEIQNSVKGTIKYIKKINNIDKTVNNGYSVVGNFVGGNLFNTDCLYFIESNQKSSNKYTYIYYYLMYYVNDDFKIIEIETNKQITRVYGGKSYLEDKNIYPKIWGKIEARM